MAVLVLVQSFVCFKYSSLGARSLAAVSRSKVPQLVATLAGGQSVVYLMQLHRTYDCCAVP